MLSSLTGFVQAWDVYMIQDDINYISEYLQKIESSMCPSVSWKEEKIKEVRNEGREVGQEAHWVSSM